MAYSNTSTKRIKPEFMPLIALTAVSLPQINPFALPLAVFTFWAVNTYGVEEKHPGDLKERTT